MILVHRLTPFAIGLLVLVSFLFASSVPHASLILLPVTFLLCAFLFARLINMRLRNLESWVLLGTPLLLLFSASLLFLFLDANVLRVLLGVLTAFFLYFYGEHVFGFIHLPVLYQPHALQNLTIVLHVLGMFFFTGSLYALILFVPYIPIPALTFIMAPYVFVSIFMSLWMGKAPRETIRRYAFSGMVLFVEIFLALSFLPSTFTTSASIFSILFYLFLGLTRVHVQAKLSRTLLKRYVGIGVGMLLLVIFSAAWT